MLKAMRGFNDNLSSSMHLVVMDRHTGKVLWTADARTASATTPPSWGTAGFTP